MKDQGLTCLTFISGMDCVGKGNAANKKLVQGKNMKSCAIL